MHQIPIEEKQRRLMRTALISCAVACAMFSVALLKLILEVFHHTSYILASSFLLAILFSNVLSKLCVSYIKTYAK